MKNILNSNDERKKYTLYVKLKLLLRFEIVQSLKNRFDDQMEIIGNDWKIYPFKSTPSPHIGAKDYNKKDINFKKFL